jgi:hypothetical protein
VSDSKAGGYRQHIQSLAREHDVEIVIRKGSRGRASRRQRLIKIPAVRGQVSYLVALHELGHIVGRYPKLRHDREVAAWRWALDNSIDEPTAASYERIAESLASYASCAHNGRGRGWRMKHSPLLDEFLAEIAPRWMKAS